jgi:hypothetical protein
LEGEGEEYKNMLLWRNRLKNRVVGLFFLAYYRNFLPFTPTIFLKTLVIKKNQSEFKGFNFFFKWAKNHIKKVGSVGFYMVDQVTPNI